MGSKILIIDDQNLLLNAFRRGLRRYKVEVDTAEGGRDGIEKALAEDEGYALIFCDVNMPDENGVKVVKAIRAAGCTTPIVFCSGGLLDLVNEVRALIRSGEVLLLLNKPPFDFAEIRNLLRAVSGGQSH